VLLLTREQEHALAELERQRAGYAGLVGRLPCPTVLIDASRDAQAVRRDVTAHIARALQQRG
jgi:thymidylate kinase